MSDFDPDEVDREPFDQMDLNRAASTETSIRQMGLEGEAAENYRNLGKHWILVDDEPKAVGMFDWICWLEMEETEDGLDPRILERHEVMSPGGRIFTISTVFLALDHNFYPGGPPLLFETMIFDWERRKSERWSHWQQRYSTAAQARAGHMKAMEAVETGVDPDGE